ncbi:Cathepsin_L [Hexamita inflata]|uniref:Cathepsin L n=1 Tax=Hexamita inflata TaxID=28002 RepID=A0AA86V1J3_9EUKA|nr:Cathepsin L [Hexamita inflata]
MLSLFQVINLEYKNYTVFTHFQVPFSTNQQYYLAVNDADHGIQYHHFINDAQQIVDPVLSFNNDNVSYYNRIHKDHEECIFSKESSPVEFLPNLTAYDHLQQTTLNNQIVEHFRQFGSYETDTSGLTFAANSTLQNDFFCQMQNGVCVPIRWELRGRSNFDSHQDYYLLEFTHFTTEVDDKYLKPMNDCKQTTPRKHHPLQFIRNNANQFQNINVLNEINKNEHFTFKVAPNKFINNEPLQRKPKRLHEPDLPECIIDPVPLPKQLDWRIRGGVNYVQDQVFCGSCWTFATMGMLESRINIMQQQNNKNEPLIKLSEQSIVDCFWDEHPADSFLKSQGCEGGQPDYAIQWLKGLPGFALAENYPYFGQNDYCKMEKFTFNKYAIDQTCKVPKTVEALKLALLSGPVAITVDVISSFTFYTGGVYNDPDCKSDFELLDHNVVCVGWGVDAEFGEYWIVRNSWSSNWGIDGYIYISTQNNICGVLTDASYVTLKTK